MSKAYVVESPTTITIRNNQQRRIHPLAQHRPIPTARQRSPNNHPPNTKIPRSILWERRTHDMCEVVAGGIVAKSEDDLYV